MDKLTPQTAYVPVKERQPHFIILETKFERTYGKELPNVYPLTGQQIHDLIAGWDYRVHTTIKDYLSSKGVTI